jgi:mono/diheme cytochrome c family protein
MMRSLLNHKLVQFFLALVLAIIFFQFGIPLISRLVIGRAAPVPSHLLWAIYMPLVILGLFLYVSANENAWEEFKAPFNTLILEREKRSVIAVRTLLLILLPLLAGWIAYLQVRPSVSPPAELRSIHPAPPGAITIDGVSVDLRTGTNPFREANGSPNAEALAAGKAIFGQYCVQCHGDALDGKGLFAPALKPLPADFTDPGTIRQLTESFLFWRIAKGGPGLPAEGKGWNSAMPAWEGILSQDEIWQVILYLYAATGVQPRAVGE